jgi:hypothetical protein
MHAYAADDPAFLAMNARGQRETSGKLGDFCVRCHAPVAVLEHATSDGLNLAELPRHLRGVTCYFCHNVAAVEGTHNNPLVLANDTTLRGGIVDPDPRAPHGSRYSELLDSDRLESSALCGACHDVVTSAAFAPADVHLERTFAEWQETHFNRDGQVGLRCGNCHMASVNGTRIASLSRLPARTRHKHDFPGVDTAVTPFPNTELQQQAVQEFLDRTLRVEVCVSRDLPQFSVLLDNFGAGHSWPSGAGQDRRAWVEVSAYAGETLLLSSGQVADHEDITAYEGSDAWLLRDRTYKLDGSPAHMFWDVARIESDLIPGARTANIADPAYLMTHRSRAYPARGLLSARPDRIRIRVRLRAIGLDILDDLITSGDLARELRDEYPVFDIAPLRHAAPPWPSDVTVEWTRQSARDRRYAAAGSVLGRPADCVATSRSGPPR